MCKVKDLDRFYELIILTAAHMRQCRVDEYTSIDVDSIRAARALFLSFETRLDALSESVALEMLLAEVLFTLTQGQDGLLLEDSLGIK